jgi:small subunit ribosomal protein S20
MANNKSAEKRHRQSEKNRAQNRIYRSGARSAIKKARLSIDASPANSEEAVKNAIKALDQAAAKGVIHPNNAARRKSRLVLMLNKAKAAA